MYKEAFQVQVPMIDDFANAFSHAGMNLALKVYVDLKNCISVMQCFEATQFEKRQ